MFSQQHELAVVTVVLPSAGAEHVIGVLHEQTRRSIWVAKARGTTVRDRWYARWLPPISPAKTMLQLVVPQRDVDSVVSTIASEGRLHLQATGAVFAQRCDAAFRGEHFGGAGDGVSTGASPSVQQMRDNLRLINCIVSPRDSEKVARAAINAGSHGPIVHFVEGYGLRDRLGWLRITKEPEKEALQVLADEDSAEDIFEAMAQAGEFHLPARGIMYSQVIDQGIFNLPGLISHHHREASMQQIIHAIDHLQGHTHWRDQSVFNVGAGGRGTGVKLATPRRVLENQTSLNAIVCRDDANALMEMILNAGAPGLTVNFSRIAEPSDPRSSAASPARVNREYAHLRCIIDPIAAKHIGETIEPLTAKAGIDDLFFYTQTIPRVATYLPSNRNYRKAS